MDATHFAPAEIHNELLEIGKTDWIHWHSILYENTQRRQAKAQLQPVIDQFSSRSKRVIESMVDSQAVAPLQAIADLIAHGPKMFRPSPSQCEAMSQVEARLSALEYQQPYSSIIIEFPKDFAKQQLIPPAVLCHRPKDCIIFLAGNPFAPNHKSDAYDFLFVSHDNENPMEKLFETVIDNATGIAPVFNVSLAYRIAINCCLALTHYSIRLQPPSAPKLMRLATSKNPYKRERAQRLLLRQPRIIEFEQEIHFHETETKNHTHNPSEPTGRHVTTHWRRGHWRRQPHGPGRTERKLIFIKPILVRSDLFAGTADKTRVTYIGHDTRSP